MSSRAACKVCGASEAWPTVWQAQAAAVWHIFETHPQRWVALYGNRLPNDPRPEELAAERLTQVGVDDTIGLVVPRSFDHPGLAADPAAAKMLNHVLHDVALQQLTSLPQGVDGGWVAHRELDHEEWMITRTPADLESFAAVHECSACLAARDQMLARLAHVPDQSVAIGRIRYTEFVYLRA